MSDGHTNETRELNLDARFCDVCDIVKDLHPQPYDESDPGCVGAEAKARILGLFRVSA